MTGGTIGWTPLNGEWVDIDDSLGNKAKNLKKVSGLAGVETPRGLAILPEFSSRVLAAHVLELRSILASGNDPDRTANELAKSIESSDSPVLHELQAWWNATSDYFGPEVDSFAVRSSGHPVVKGAPLAEDSELHSMAGQYSSFLHVPRNDVPAMYLRCVASLFNSRSIQTFGIARDDSYLNSSITVLIQEMIPGFRSGVMMTVDPVEHNPDLMGIEGGCGECERFVSGAMQGDFYLINRNDGRIVEYELGSAVLGCSHKVDAPTVRCFSDGELASLLQAGEAIEKFYGAPQDIEFTFGSPGRPIILQTRPITTK